MFNTLGIPIVPRFASDSESGSYLNNLSYLYLYIFGKSFFSTVSPAPFSHLFPDINLLPFSNIFIVSKQ